MYVIWNTHGIGMEYAWNMLWNMHGICVEYAWNMHGVCMEYAWTTYGIALKYPEWPLAPDLQEWPVNPM